MRVIYKSPMALPRPTATNEPVDVIGLDDPVPVSFGWDPHGQACVWLSGHPLESLKCTAKLEVVGTGWEFEGGHVLYAGSLVQGSFVWHALVRRVV